MNTDTSNAGKRTRFQSNTMFYVLMVIALYLAYIVIGPFWDTVAAAVVTVILVRPLYLLYMRWFKDRNRVAIPLTILSVILFVLIPAWFVLRMSIWQAQQIAEDLAQSNPFQNPSFQALLDSVNEVLAGIPFLSGVQLTGANITQALHGALTSAATWLASGVVSLGTSFVIVLTKAVIYLILLSSMLPAWPKLLEMVRILSPLDDTLDQMYIDRMSIGTVGLIRAGLLSMLLQGLSMTFFLWIAGIPYLFFWFLLCTALAILPIGCSLVAFPIGIYLIIVGQTWQGLVVILGYIIVTANITAVTQSVLFPKSAQVNKALILLALFGGIALFGIQGACYGPLVMVFIVTTIHILLHRFGSQDQLEAPPKSQPEATGADTK